MALVITEENLHEAERRIEKRAGRKIGIETEIRIGIRIGKETRIGIGREIKRGVEIEIEIEIETVIVTVTEIGIGIGVIEVTAIGIERMMMITTEVESVIGGEITNMIEMIDVNIGLVQGEDLSAGQGLGLALALTQKEVIPGMFPNMLQLTPGQPLGALPIMPAQAMTQQATRHARRVYVGGLTPTANEQSVATFFSHVMAAIGGNTAGPGDAVVNVYINHEKKFAFVEMSSVEEASNGMALDGIIFEGTPVEVRRPSDYNPSLAATLGPSQPNPNLNLAAVGLTPGSAGGLEGPDRIFVGGVPYY